MYCHNSAMTFDSMSSLKVQSASSLASCRYCVVRVVFEWVKGITLKGKTQIRMARGCSSREQQFGSARLILF